MTLSNFLKSNSRLASLFGFLAISNFVVINSAEAFSVTLTNRDFETGSTTGWSMAGDVDVIGSGIVSADGVNIDPIQGSFQAIITNAYNSQVDDVDNLDNPLSFNQSGTDPLDADTNDDTADPGNDLQIELGLPTSAFSIDRNPVISGNPRTSKEGSAIYQDFTVTLGAGETGFDISFNFAFLTNDGATAFGNQDFAFLSVYNTDLTPDDIEVLADSSGSISDPTGSNNFVQGDTTYYNTSNPYTFSVNGLTSEQMYNYRIALGVIDVDSSDRSSALLVDNFQIQPVPFKFSPGLGLVLMTGCLGLDQLRRRSQQDQDSSD